MSVTEAMENVAFLVADQLTEDSATTVTSDAIGTWSDSLSYFIYTYSCWNYGIKKDRIILFYFFNYYLFTYSFFLGWVYSLEWRKIDSLNEITHVPKNTSIQAVHTAYCTYIHTYIHIHIYIHTCTYIIHTYIHVYIHKHIWVLP